MPPYQEDNTVSAQSEAPRDAQLSDQLERQLREAAELATFHRVEAERWERVGRASAAAMRELQAAYPVAQVTPDALVEAVRSTDEPAGARALPFQQDPRG